MHSHSVPPRCRHFDVNRRTIDYGHLLFIVEIDGWKGRLRKAFDLTQAKQKNASEIRSVLCELENPAVPRVNSSVLMGQANCQQLLLAKTN